LFYTSLVAFIIIQTILAINLISKFGYTCDLKLQQSQLFAHTITNLSLSHLRIMITHDLSFANLSELSHLLRTRQISSLALTEHFLARLNAHSQRYNALAQLTPDLALAQAKQADAALAKHTRRHLPLLGIPYGAKDLLATQGIPTRWGSPAHADQVLDYDATTIVRLREAGAPMLGKLAMVEMAGGGGYSLPNASLHGPGLNPWDVTRWSGGSSSGSGSAVAAGLAPFALGSETWGSIITPSAYCGITGLRPTYGLVSRYGAMELAWTMDKVGPMAHTAEDCGTILQAIAGPDSKDPTTIKSFIFNPEPDISGIRLGVLPADFTDVPEIEKAFKSALSVLRKAGANIKPIKWDETFIANINTIANTLLYAEMGAAHEDFIKSGRVELLVDKPQIDGLKNSLNVSGAAVIQAQQQRAQATHDVFATLKNVDALVSPALMIEAPTLDTNLRTAFRRRGGYSVLGALCGLPALTVPMGFGKSGLPLGLNFTGNLWAENIILSLGMAFQRETDWHTRHPIV
jgi:aspartyl-tRNA(Asn)/glutamyl-tRNA(Gln) amidotransferase subunit A